MAESTKRVTKAYELNWVDKPVAVEELPTITSTKSYGFLRFVAELQAHPEQWYKIAEGDASGNDLSQLRREFNEFEFATRTNPDAFAKNPGTGQHVRNKDLYARYMGLEWYVQQVHEKQDRRRKVARGEAPKIGRPSPTAIPPHRPTYRDDDPVEAS